MAEITLDTEGSWEAFNCRLPEPEDPEEMDTCPRGGACIKCSHDPADWDVDICKFLVIDPAMLLFEMTENIVIKMQEEIIEKLRKDIDRLEKERNDCEKRATKQTGSIPEDDGWSPGAEWAESRHEE